MSRFDVGTNLDADTVGQQLGAYWQWLLDERRTTPSLAIATAYFNPGGFLRLADQLEAARRVRLLLGAEPHVSGELSQVRPLSERPPSEAPRLSLQQQLVAHHRDMAEDRDLHDLTQSNDATIERLVTWLRTGSVEVRRLESRFLHGKAYLVESDHEGVLVGSSNLTRAGLTSNVELNLGRYDPAPVAEVQAWFERLWDEAVPFDLAGLYEHRFAEHQPYAVFLRMLWEQYRFDLDEPEASPRELDLTQFQKDGLYRAVKYLHRYNGVLIADGVGLGKTYLAGELLRQTTYEQRQRALVVAPAALRDGPWRQFLAEQSQIMGVERVSYDELAADPRLGGSGRYALNYDPREYAMVVIDEAHALRNPSTQRAQALRRLLAGSPPKKLVLLTATPVNNSLWDLYQLLALFVRNDAEFLEAGVPSLREHFADAQRTDPDTLSPDVLFDVLDAVAVRRTRRFVKRFYPNEVIRRDGVETPITFPQAALRRVDYDFDQVLPGFFEDFAHALGVDPSDPDNPLATPKEFHYDPQRRLTLARYAPSSFLIAGDADAYETQAAGLLRSGLLKRFESSPHAFARTCAAMVASHEQFLRALDDGWVLTGDALAAFAATDSDDFDPVAVGGGGRRESALQYDLKGLRAAVEADMALLDDFRIRGASVSNLNDPKLAALVDQLAEIAADAHTESAGGQQERDRRKVLVFSYYADTVEWIAQHLEHATVNDDRIQVYRDRWSTLTGSGDKQEALWGFAPTTSQAPPEHHEDRFDVLVSTDVLAEGVNLQQARHIINFDLPWNPMRMVQRHGRIDRIGSPHSRVFMRSFFPSTKLNELLGLEAALHRKLTQAAKSIGVEGEVVPGLDAADERVFADADEKLRRLYNEDAGLLDEVEDTGSLSGEEFRRELADCLADLGWKKTITELPWVAGTGRKVDDAGGFVFCARIGDHPRPVFRYLPLTPDGTLDGDAISDDVLTCLAHAACDDSTRRELPKHLHDAAYEAWEVARNDIFDSWTERTDPANIAPSIPKPMREAADLLRRVGAPDLSWEKTSYYIDIIEAPYDPRTQQAFRRIVRDENLSDQERAIELVRLIDDYALEAPIAIKPLPEITPADIHLVCWMALAPPTH